jgi:glycine oxidase
MADCIIIGGGLIGMLTARELQQAGAEVLILERGNLGGESSWAGGGILSPLYPWRYGEAVNQLANYGHKAYPQLAESLLEESGIDPEYTQSGMLVLDQQEKSSAIKWSSEWQIRLDPLESQKIIQQIEPAINPEVEQALWMPEIAQMRNPRLIKALRGSLESRGIHYIEQAEVNALGIDNGEVKSVSTHSQSYDADKVVIAGGAWSHGILQSYARPPEIEPVKGQMILFKAKPGLLKTMVLFGGRYLIPRRDGRILAGSTLEHTGFSKNTTNEAQEDLYQSAIELVPQLAEAEIEHHWAGLRPGTSDGIPYICHHPDINGLYISSGHFRNGVILGAASATLMKDIIMQKSPILPTEPYELN